MRIFVNGKGSMLSIIGGVVVIIVVVIVLFRVL